MNYTCAYWKDVKDDDDLNQAQINKLDLVARKLKLKPGMRVLDIGSGFGAAAKYLAQNYGVNVVGYNSKLRSRLHYDLSHTKGSVICHSCSFQGAAKVRPRILQGFVG